MKKTKTCSCCKKELSINLFHNHRRSKDGHQSRCKECSKKYIYQLRRKNPEYAKRQLEGIIKWQNTNKEKYLEKQREYRKKQKKTKPEQVNAHKVASRINITSPCYFCSSNKNLIRHHYDYSKPKDVTILCRSCHSKFHYLYDMQKPHILVENTKGGEK